MQIRKFIIEVADDGSERVQKEIERLYREWGIEEIITEKPIRSELLEVGLGTLQCAFCGAEINSEIHYMTYKNKINFCPCCGVQVGGFEDESSY